MNKEEAKSTNSSRIRLTLNVDYALNGQTIDEMASRLSRMVELAIGDGTLTGGTEAEYSMHTRIVPELLTEEELATYMQQRIESGDLCAEDVAVRLARYGLMDPFAFVDEMREGTYLDKCKDGRVFFSGNVNEYSAAFRFLILDTALVATISSLAPEVPFRG